MIGIYLDDESDARKKDIISEKLGLFDKIR
jgi:hypothetical protein